MTSLQRSVSRATAIAVSLAAVVLTVPACKGKNTQAGGLEVIIATNLLASQYDSIVVNISQQTSGDQWNNLINRTILVPSEETLPASYSIAAGSSPDQVALIQVQAVLQGNPVDSRTAQVQVPTTYVGELTLILAQCCAGVTCAAGLTCQPQAATCGCNSNVVSGPLPPYSAGDVGGADASAGAFPSGGSSSSSGSSGGSSSGSSSSSSSSGSGSSGSSGSSSGACTPCVLGSATLGSCCVQ